MNPIKYLVIRLLPIRNIIVFESAPDYSDNTMAVFNEFNRIEIWKKYKLVWINQTKTTTAPKHSVNGNNSRLLSCYYRASAKCLISCNCFMANLKEGQYSFYLMHGTPVKRLRDYHTLPSGIDYMLTASEKVNELDAYEFAFPVEKCIALGYPRNDDLINSHADLKKLFGDFDKFIVWYPTVRQFKSGRTTGSANALPVINNEESAKALNECAKKNNVLVILKPHFAQDISYIKKQSMSNIKFIDDAFFRSNGITSYEFVGSCDALLTDYSSIYYDYLLCDRPIGLVWEDLEEYKSNPGVINDFERLMQGGKQIYDINQFCAFVDDVANNVDELREIRNKICDETNYSRDGKSAKRVVDFIIEKAKL